MRIRKWLLQQQQGIPSSLPSVSLELKQEEGDIKINHTSILSATETSIGFLSTADVPLKNGKAIERDTVTKKASKKCFRKHGQDTELQEGKGDNINSTKYVGKGSRCNRANGRGWRCYRKTLVGYSLCEHHLGKSRLRSLKKSLATKRADEVANLAKSSYLSSQLGPSFIDENEEECDADDNCKKFGMAVCHGTPMNDVPRDAPTTVGALIGAP